MSRDLVLSRLAAARGFATRVSNQLDEIIELFLLPEEDPKGRERAELFEGVIDDAGLLSRMVEKAQAAFEQIDPREPFDDDEAEDEEDAEAER